MKTAWHSHSSARSRWLRKPRPRPQPISLNLREGTNMAAALSPDGRTLMIDLQGSLWTLPASGGAGQTRHRRIPRRAAAGMGAGQSPRRVPGIRRRRLAHLRDERRRLRPARDHLGSVRRSRAVVVARRQPHRVLVGSIGQLRRLGSRRRRRRGSSADEAIPRTTTRRRIRRSMPTIAFVSEREDRRGIWASTPRPRASVDRARSRRRQRAVVDARRRQGDLQRHRRQSQQADDRWPRDHA